MFTIVPNGGKEDMAIKKLFRIVRKAVVLMESCYKVATENAPQHMRDHGYVRDLKATSEAVGSNVIDHRLLDICSNPQNPSGVTILVKPSALLDRTQFSPETIGSARYWGSFNGQRRLFYADSVGIAYPVLQGVPLLRPEHAVVASALSDS